MSLVHPRPARCARLLRLAHGAVVLHDGVIVGIAPPESTP